MKRVNYDFQFKTFKIKPDQGLFELSEEFLFALFCVAQFPSVTDQLQILEYFRSKQDIQAL